MRSPLAISSAAGAFTGIKLDSSVAVSTSVVGEDSKLSSAGASPQKVVLNDSAD